MKKLKNEAELVKAAILAGVKYAEKRGAAIFEATDSQSEKILYIYRLLVHDKIIQPMPEDQVSQQSMRHKLAIWHMKQLPKDHPLLK
jgi:predicted transcriptional regulator